MADRDVICIESTFEITPLRVNLLNIRLRLFAIVLALLDASTENQ